jgi:hypothetical protein
MNALGIATGAEAHFIEACNAGLKARSSTEEKAVSIRDFKKAFYSVRRKDVRKRVVRSARLSIKHELDLKRRLP